MSVRNKEEYGPFKKRLYEIIFEADTREGKIFDIVLIVFILLSIVIVNLESVPSIAIKYGTHLYVFEWILTIFFTIEYALRIYSSYKPWRYVKSMYGIIDLLAILPTYLSPFIVGSNSLMVIRALRLLRVFRIFKMVGFLNQGTFIVRSLKNSRDKITVFLFFIFIIVNIIGSLMYLIEGGVNDTFDSIPRSIYWTIVTLTTVGYGDISPITPLGQTLAAVVMLLGYAIIAVPTGIVTGEVIKETKKHSHEISTQVCANCTREGHDANADFCKYCGFNLHTGEDEEAE